MNLTTLKQALTRLSPIIPTRSPLPVLSCVRLASGDGTMTLEASNLDQAMRITLPYAGKPVDCCVAHRKLLQVPGDGEVEFIPGGGTLRIVGFGFSSKLDTLPQDEFPELNLTGDNEACLLYTSDAADE